MSQNYSLHFYLKKPKNYVKGPKFIYMRISAGSNDIPKDASVGRTIEPEQWLASANRAKGSGETARTLNSYLEAIERNIEQIHTYFEKHQLEITAEKMLNKYLGKSVDFVKSNHHLSFQTDHQTHWSAFANPSH